MPVGLTLPSHDVLRSVEDRAAQILDPIAKLRFLRAAMAAHPARSARRNLFQMSSAGTLAALLLLLLAYQTSDAVAIGQYPNPAKPKTSEMVPSGQPPDVWLVEKRGRTEVYSNGLRIENDFATSAKPRSYLVLSRDPFQVVQRASNPAGIVFHTSESQMAPFESGHNADLKRNGLSLLAYVRKHQLYHFVIDRFGRVHRVVPESDSANHAGFSMWADSKYVYMNLNQSFLGVSFEAQSEGNPTPFIARASQVFAARILTEMLRSRYRIPESNCVTHAQVSVNPQNHRIGYHTDWAANFPFREIGLTGGYEASLPAITLFGFGYDETFLRSAGAPAWKGLIVSEEQLVHDAVSRGIALLSYRKLLQQRYRDLVAELKKSAAPGEEQNYE
jgi:hypothetical protein